MNETPTLDSNVDVPQESSERPQEVVEAAADQEQAAKIQVKVEIVDLEQMEKLLAALKEAGVSPTEILEAASAGGSSLTALQQSLAEHLSLEQMEQLSRVIEAMQSTTNS